MKELYDLKKELETLTFNEQNKILDIFIKYKCQISENRNGSFINLTYINDECLNEIKHFLNYIKEQEIDLKKNENTKLEIQKTFFENDNSITNEIKIESDKKIKKKRVLKNKTKEKKDNNNSKNIVISKKNNICSDNE